MIEKTVEKITPKFGLVSLVGVWSEDYPVSFGNYFDFATGERSVNMWYENLKEWVKKNPTDGIECTVFSYGYIRMAFVTDKRIPKEWLHKDLCVTGRGWGSREMCEACCEFQGAGVFDRICGCEKPSQEPHIGNFYFTENKKRKQVNHCGHCGRKWDSK